MSLVRRPLATVLSVASTLVVGSVAVGLAPAGAVIAPVGSSTAPRTVAQVTPKPVKPKVTTPTKVTIQAISKTTSQAQSYRAIFRGVLVNAKTKEALVQRQVVLMVHVRGSKAWTRAVTAVSSAPDGKLLVAVEQDAPSADYKFVFDADAPLKASSSAVVTVKRT
jgi:hypothetical protein